MNNEIREFKEKIKKKSGEFGLREECMEQAINNLAIHIKSKEDLFLYCASLNYLNRYIKLSKAKNDRKILESLKEKFPKMKFKNGYGFKKFINIALVSILDHDFEDVKFKRFSRENNLVMIVVDGIQFAFHGVFVFNDILEEIVKEEKMFGKGKKSKITDKQWEGLRLQPIAQEVYDFATELRNKYLESGENE